MIMNPSVFIWRFLLPSPGSGVLHTHTKKKKERKKNMPPWLSPAGKDLPQHFHLLDESERLRFVYSLQVLHDGQSHNLMWNLIPYSVVSVPWVPWPSAVNAAAHSPASFTTLGNCAWQLGWPGYREMPGSLTPSPKATKDCVMWRHRSPTSLPRVGADSGAIRAPKIPEVLYQGYTSPGKHILASFLLPWSAFFTPLLTFPLSFLNKLFTWKSLSQAVSREYHLRQPHVVPWFPSQSFQLAPCYTRSSLSCIILVLFHWNSDVLLNTLILNKVLLCLIKKRLQFSILPIFSSGSPIPSQKKKRERSMWLFFFSLFFKIIYLAI